jgi:putative Mn2+ efflux pump MntP
MLVDAVRAGDEPTPPGTLFLYLGLALATSIDAAAAGLSLHLLPVEPWLALTLIGAITAACCVAGYAAGRALGHKVGSKLGAVGGLVLVAIGIDILIRAP